MMASVRFVFCLTCLFVGQMAQVTDQPSSVRQESGFISTDVGDSITLRCFYEGDVITRFYWYKQTVGEKPRLISTFYKFAQKGTFYDEYQDDPRVTLDTKKGCNHLKIEDLRISDSATYYCASSSTLTYMFEFAGGTTVNIKGSGSNVKASVHQSASETVQPGDSVTLNCTVHTGTCDGGHSVYWFKNQEEEASHPGLIYTHGGRSDQCERNPDTQTHTCVYNLPMKSLNLSHAGTYYCAVASCGRILFGDGTKLSFQDADSLVLVYCLSGAIALTQVLLLSLACVINKIKSCLCTASQEGFSDPLTGRNAKGCVNEYTASREKKINKSRRQRDDTWSECVYFTVRQ